VSNFLTIAAVTATLQRELHIAASDAISGATATVTRPDGAAAATPPLGVNIFLYQVTPNAAQRNSDLPNRGSDGAVARRPRTALDLHYLLSFYGNEAQLEPQRLLGGVTQRLTSRPILTDAMINAMLADAAFNFLVLPTRSDLADEDEAVRFTPMGLSLEELSKLWSVFFQTPYALSVAYQASTVFIEGKEAASAGLPVRERTITVLPFRSPTINEVFSDLGRDLPIQAGSILTIRGRKLLGDVTRVSINGAEQTPAPPDMSDTEIKIALPPGSNCGINSVQIVHKLMLGIPPAEHRGFESNVAAFVVAPKITIVSATAANFKIDIDPPVRVSQRATLLLNHVPSGASHTFSIPPVSADTPQVDFPVSGLTSGEKYFVRVRVDGAESTLLDLNPASPTFKQFILPQVTIP
jgi:hypothetical protein